MEIISMQKMTQVENVPDYELLLIDINPQFGMFFGKDFDVGFFLISMFLFWIFF